MRRDQLLLGMIVIYCVLQRSYLSTNIIVSKLTKKITKSLKIFSQLIFKQHFTHHY